MRVWIHGVPRRYLAVLLLFVFIDAVFPKRAGAAQGQVVLSGSVVARATGQPIVDATVIIEGSGNAARTNAAVIIRAPLNQPNEDLGSEKWRTQ